jgi:hypothetical protein
VLDADNARFTATLAQLESRIRRMIAVRVRPISITKKPSTRAALKPKALFLVVVVVVVVSRAAQASSPCVPPILSGLSFSC